MDNKYIKIIKSTPLFHGMSDEEIAQFLRPDGSGIKSFRKESYIFTQETRPLISAYFWRARRLSNVTNFGAAEA